MSLEENLAAVRANIARAAIRSGRRPEDITLIGVTKTIDAARVNELVSLGVDNLGENRVQELLAKQPEVPGAAWHLIGHLQTNKVRQVVGKVAMIHSLDSLKLAAEIERVSEKLGVVTDVLIEVNAAGEDTKDGVPPNGVIPLAEALTAFPHIRLRGLMTVAPFDEEPRNNKVYFAQLRNLRLDISQKVPYHKQVDCLSMGMTNDYEAAIEEGATMVRVGAALFGHR